MFQFDIIWRGKTKKVKGEQVGDYFGIDYRLGEGWMITHLFTGHLLTIARFATKEDAVYFAQLADKIFGDVLASPDARVLLENRYGVPGGNVLYTLRSRIEDLDKLVTKEVIDGQVEIIRSQQREANNSKENTRERTP